MRFASIASLAVLAGLVASPALGQRAASASPDAGPGCRGPFTQEASPSGLSGSNLFSATAVGSHEEWAAGRTFTGSGYQNLVLFHGQQWTQSQVPDPSATYSVLYGVSASSDSDVWAVGKYTTGSQSKPFAPEALHFDGSSWTSVPLPALAGEEDSDFGPVVVDISAADAWMGGSWLGSGGKGHSYLAHWDGTSWSLVSHPGIAAVLGLAASGPRDVWMVGVGPGPSFPAVIEHYNGSKWKISDTLAGFHLSGVTSVSRTQAWAVGSGPSGTATVEWNGSAWTVVPSPNPGSGAGLAAVGSAGPGGVWAAGSQEDFSTGAGEAEPMAMHWNGTAWTVASGLGTVTGASAYEGGFTGVAVTSPSQVIVVGQGAGPAAARLCSFPVLDTGFGMASATTTGPGASAYWVFPKSDAASHDLADGSGFGLFDSGSQAPGSSYSFTYPASGTWPVTDTSDGAIEHVRVPVNVIMGGTIPRLWWGDAAPPAGATFNVQVMRPGSTKFAFFRNTTALTGVLPKHAPAGTYRFRSRLRDSATAVATGWSPVLTITVP